MSEWISIKERLPEVGEPVWVRFSKKNGDARKVNPVVAGDFGNNEYFQTSIGFIVGVHRNILYPPDYCPEVGLTHWQARQHSTPPSAQIPVISSPKGEKQKRRYHLTPEGLAAKRAAIREYWRKRNGNATIAGERTE